MWHFHSGKSPLTAPVGRRNDGEMGWERGMRETQVLVYTGTIAGVGEDLIPYS